MKYKGDTMDRTKVILIGVITFSIVILLGKLSDKIRNSAPPRTTPNAPSSSTPRMKKFTK